MVRARSKILVRQGSPPRPRHLGREIEHATELARPYRRVCALFDGTRFEDHGVSRDGRQPRRSPSEPCPSERSFQLFACWPHPLPFTGGDALITPNSYGSGGSHVAESPLLAHG